MGRCRNPFDFIRDYITALLCVWAVFTITHCAGFVRTGNEPLEEARIIAAVNAERHRWITELSGRINAGLREVEERIGKVGTGLQQITVAAQEYRHFVLSIIDRLQQLETEAAESSSDVNSGNSGAGGH